MSVEPVEFTLHSQWVVSTRYKKPLEPKKKESSSETSDLAESSESSEGLVRSG